MVNPEVYTLGVYYCNAGRMSCVVMFRAKNVELQNIYVI